MKKEHIALLAAGGIVGGGLLAYFASRPPNHTCPEGQHWDAELGKCVDDAVVPAKTIMFITHMNYGLPESVRTQINTYMTDPGYTGQFRVWPYNYIFPDFVPPTSGSSWGNYFTWRTSITQAKAGLQKYAEMGLGNILYVDPTESSQGWSYRWPDSILQHGGSGDWWDLMTLDPSKSWYKYLKAGMIAEYQTYGDFLAGFAIDRLDRCANTQEAVWAAQLLDEVRDEVGSGIEYCFNSLMSWQTSLVTRANFIGSDGLPDWGGCGTLAGCINTYADLAQYATLKDFYINPPMDAPNLLSRYREILSLHDFVFFDDYYFGILEAIFPRAPL
jgi:hypothetical protein